MWMKCTKGKRCRIVVIIVSFWIEVKERGIQKVVLIFGKFASMGIFAMLIAVRVRGGYGSG
jgi:hypothetical protein